MIMYLSTFRSIYSNIADMNMEEENAEAVEYAGSEKCCTRKFLTKKKFQDYVNTHTGVKLFSCTVCSKYFHSRYYKSKHEKVCTG